MKNIEIIRKMEKEVAAKSSGVWVDDYDHRKVYDITEPDFMEIYERYKGTAETGTWQGKLMIFARHTYQRFAVRIIH